MKSISYLLLLFAAACVLTCPALAEPQSYKQIAEKALFSGDRAKAIEYYSKWVEADPTDAVSLYNLACCYALDSLADSAMSALTKAVAAGWNDSTHTLFDPDLQPLHSKPKFSDLLSDIARNSRIMSSAYNSQYCIEERQGRYVVVLPDQYDPRQQYPLVILLHNYGGSPEDFSQVTSLINTRDFIYAIPEGAYTVANSGGKGFAYLRDESNYVEDPQSAAPAADWVIRVADDVAKKFPVSGKKFWMVGFSQGAALAHIVAAEYPERVAGYCAHAGYMIKNVITEKQLAAEKKAGMQVLITLGKQDVSVAPEEGIYTSNTLKQAGLNVEFEMLDIPHAFTGAVGEKVNSWLKSKMTKK